MLVDPGWDSDEGWHALVEGLERLGASIDRVIGVVATHAHVDHLPLARRVAGASGAWVGLLQREIVRLGRLLARGADPESERQWLLGCGVPLEELPALDASDSIGRLLGTMPTPDLVLADGDTLPLPGRTVRVLATPGHTSGHLVLIDLDNRAVISGDHVLPTISPNIGLFPDDEPRDAVGEYLSSLAALTPYGDYVALPAHQYAFSGLGARITELRTHHEARHAELAGILAADPGLSAWAIAERLSWSLGWAGLDGRNRRFALAETIAHAHHHARLSAEAPPV